MTASLETWVAQLTQWLKAQQTLPSPTLNNLACGKINNHSEVFDDFIS